eukprot:3601589-Prorocentrum_lima.AAC.1
MSASSMVKGQQRTGTSTRWKKLAYNSAGPSIVKVDHCDVYLRSNSVQEELVCLGCTSLALSSLA